MSITYQNASADITLKQSIALHLGGVAVAINDGKDITFICEKEKRSSIKSPKQNNHFNSIKKNG